MKYFDVSPLDNRVRDIQAKDGVSLTKAVNIVKLNDIQNHLKRGGDTRTVVFALVDFVRQLILQLE